MSRTTQVHGISSGLGHARLAWVVVLPASLGGGLRLQRSTRSRRVSCTNPCTSSPRRQVTSSVGRPVCYPRFSREARVCPWAGRSEPCRLGGSRVGLCLSGRGDDPRFASPISEGAPGCRAAPSEKASIGAGWKPRRLSAAVAVSPWLLAASSDAVTSLVHEESHSPASRTQGTRGRMQRPVSFD
jgi:hypothetical protein